MIEELKRIGLTDGEAKAYSALIKKGSSTVGPIVKESGVAYSNIYEILERLIKKGIITYIIKEKTKYFQLTNPLNLKTYVEKKQEELEEEETIVKNLLPQITRTSIELTEEAEIFTGKKGIKSAYESMLETAKHREEFLFFYNLRSIVRKDSEVNDFYLKLLNRFRKSGVIMKGIGDESHRSVSAQHRTKENQMRYVTFPIPSSMDIFQDKILLISWNSETGFLIKSRELADSFKDYFHSIWDSAKK